MLCGYLKKAMGMGEVTVRMAALIELLQQCRDAMPLGPFISLLEQASWELQRINTGNFRKCNTHGRNVWLVASVLQVVLKGLFLLIVLEVRAATSFKLLVLKKFHTENISVIQGKKDEYYAVYKMADQI